MNKSTFYFLWTIAILRYVACVSESIPLKNDINVNYGHDIDFEEFDVQDFGKTVDNKFDEDFIRELNVDVSDVIPLDTNNEHNKQSEFEIDRSIIFSDVDRILTKEADAETFEFKIETMYDDDDDNNNQINHDFGYKNRDGSERGDQLDIDEHEIENSDSDYIPEAQVSLIENHNPDEAYYRTEDDDIAEETDYEFYDHVVNINAIDKNPGGGDKQKGNHPPKPISQNSADRQEDQGILGKDQGFLDDDLQGDELVEEDNSVSYEQTVNTSTEINTDEVTERISSCFRHQTETLKDGNQLTILILSPVMKGNDCKMVIMGF